MAILVSFIKQDFDTKNIKPNFGCNYLQHLSKPDSVRIKAANNN